MAHFLLRRGLFAIVLIVASSSAALMLTRLAPGDVTIELGTRATPAEVAAARARFNLDQPLLRQWAAWAGRAVRFDFGESFLYNGPVRPVVVRAAGNSALLGLAALLVATIAGISLGIYTGSRRFAGTLQGVPYGFVAGAIRALSIACVSLPPLLTSLLLVFVAARTRWFPLGGMTSASAAAASWGEWASDVAAHLPLPVIALALPMAATFERLQSDAMREAIDQPFVTAAVARGVAPERVIVRHAWPASLRAVSAFYGLTIGALLSGSFVVEYVTAWPGLGRLMYEALVARDIYLVTGCAAFGAGLLAIGTLIGDLILAGIDPRVREG